jgi:hypothetical protein
MYGGTLLPKPGGQQGDEDIGINTIKEHLENAIERHQRVGLAVIAA